MRYLSLLEVLELHEAIIAFSGGLRGIRDIRALESAINQPRLTFDQTDLYPDLISKLPIPAKSSTCSDLFRPPIPKVIDQSFRNIPTR